jgi:gamma-glutamyl hercynylcysteine S-oxide synthase
MHDLVVRDLEQARNRTLGLTDLDDPTLVTQHDPLMSPLVWDLAHVGQQEELWLLRAGDPARPGMLPPAVDALYDAFKHPRAERPSLPLLPPVEARAYDHEVRGRVLDMIEHTPADELFTAGMVVQHEEQHDETMLATLQLRQGPPVLLGRRPLPPGRDVAPDRVFVGGGSFTLGVDAASEPFSLDNERPAHTVDVGPFWIGRVPVSNPQWCEFIADGGYQRQELWSARGWAHRTEAGLERPLFWTAEGTRRRFGVEEEVPAAEPVQHVSYFEAEAYARWAGGRLLTETEWEKACAWDPAARARRAWPWGSLPARTGPGQPGRRRPAAGAGRGVSGQRVGLRGRADDRRRLGVDVVGLRAVAWLYADDLPRLQRPVLWRGLQGAARRLLGRRPVDDPALVPELGLPGQATDLHGRANGLGRLSVPSHCLAWPAPTAERALA